MPMDVKTVGIAEFFLLLPADAAVLRVYHAHLAFSTFLAVSTYNCNSHFISVPFCSDASVLSSISSYTRRQTLIQNKNIFTHVHIHARTQVLRADIVKLVNSVAKHVHACTIDNYGAPNKNIGDAFLLVWKPKGDMGLCISLCM